MRSIARRARRRSSSTCSQFAKALPAIRAATAEDMSLRGLPREKVLATVVHLLEATLIRVGNDEYAKANQSYGLTTLKSDHVEVDGPKIRFQFTGKSGKQWSLAMRDRRVARILRACQELPGQDLLQYFDENKELRAVTSGDVNDYLRRNRRLRRHRQGFPHLGGHRADGAASRRSGRGGERKQAKKLLRAALARVAAALGNTPAVCRKSYIHPSVIEAWLEFRFKLEVAEAGATGLRPEEAAVLAMLPVRPDRHVSSHRDVLGRLAGAGKPR